MPKVGYEGMIAGQSRVLMEAVAAAAHQTGTVILFHTEQGLDMAIASMWKAYGGGPGLSVLTGEILPQLRTEGIGEAVIKKITGQSVARRLARDA